MKSGLIEKYATFWNNIAIGKEIDMQLLEECVSKDAEYLLFGRKVKRKAVEFIKLVANQLLEKNLLQIAEIGEADNQKCVYLNDNISLFDIKDGKIQNIMVHNKKEFSNISFYDVVPNSYMTTMLKRLCDIAFKDPVSLKKMILDDFELDFPISGGYGYSMDDAIILKLDTENKSVSLEYEIVRWRLYEEMIVCRETDMKFSDISWNLLKQYCIEENGRHYDHLIFQVSGIQDGKEKYYTFKSHFWFDITSSFGKH